MLLLITNIYSVFGQTNEVKKTNLELLQGKWVGIDDETNFSTFEGNNWDGEVFVLSDKCMNESDESNELEKVKDKFISLLKSEMFYYIETLDSKKLIIVYMGFVKTFEYKRVE